MGEERGGKRGEGREERGGERGEGREEVYNINKDYLSRGSDMHLLHKT